ncbi:MAG: hypothetical protein ACKO1J_18395 [Tagaea sp.]
MTAPFHPPGGFPRAPRPAVQVDLPDDAVRIRVRPVVSVWPYLWIATLAGLCMAVGLATAMEEEISLFAGTVAFLSGAGLAVSATAGRARASRDIYFDRIGIHDPASGAPPIPWRAIERLRPRGDVEIGLAMPSVQPMLVAELTAEAAAERNRGLAALFRPPSTRASVPLVSTRADGLPIPFEYLIALLRERGAPVRGHLAGFDPFPFDARWLPAPLAAQAVAERMGPRAAPFAHHNLDLARTRGQRAAAAHWDAVLDLLRPQPARIDAAE